ncbi:MAG: hypothetical protein WDA18_00450 [Candidatus Ratteibacteria bacterium]
MYNDLLLSPTKELISRFWILVSKVIVGLMMFVIGWIIAKVVKVLAVKFFKLLQIDRLVEESGFREFLIRGQITKEPSELLGNIIYWLLLIAVLFLALNVGGIAIPQPVIENLLAFIPRIIVGLIIFVLGLFVGNIMEGIVNAAAGNAGIEKPFILGKTIRIAIIVFSVVLMLEEIGIGVNFVATAFNIVLASGAIAVAIAVGLGAKDLVKEWLESTLKKKEDK